MPNDNARGGLGTVRNAAHLLELLGRGQAFHHLTDLAEHSDLSVPTVHRLLRSLVLAGLAVQDPGSSRYGLGPELVRLSHHYLSRLPLLGALSPYLPQLRDQLRSTVHVQVLVRDEVVYVDRMENHGSGPFREINRVHPALTTAGGRLLAAHAQDEDWEAILQAADPEDRDEARDRRQEWLAAPWLAHRPADAVLPAEVAVVVTDTTGAAVGVLAADLADPHDEPAVEAAAGHLTRAARAAGRTLGHG